MIKDSKTGDFKSLGEFLATVRKVSTEGLNDTRLQELMLKTMTEGTDSAGGFTVPEQWADVLYHAALEGAIVRPRAIVFPMSSDTLNVPILEDSDRSSNIFGGITLTWISETEDKAALAADPKIGELKLTAHEGVATTWVSNSLEDDVKKFEQYMKLTFGKAIRFYEDDAYIWGSGLVMGQPLGIMSSGFTIGISRKQANQIVFEDVLSMASRLMPGSWNTAVWLINQNTLTNFFSLDAVDDNIQTVIDMNKRMLFGIPFIVTEKAAALGTSGDIILADFNNGYVIGDRSMEISASRHVDYGENHYGFLRNKTFWRIVLRVDGQPILSSPITPKRGGETVSSFVVLTDQES